ncbi:MAG: ATP synthase F0 subunit B [Thermodesulfobacteriota bacterium]|nr:ATP synthase F0 subunit B [Thermodesulfobacteriota bacterium]
MEIVTIEGLITINATLVAQVVHFLILMFILNRLMFRPILKVINDRTAYTEEKREAIKELELETERLRDEFASRKNDARKDLTLEKADYRDQGMAKANAILDDSRKEAAAIKAKAEEEVGAEIDKVKLSVHGEAAALAEEIMKKVLGRRIVA